MDGELVQLRRRKPEPHKYWPLLSATAQIAVK